MKIEQIYTGCLAEAAYYIESDGEIAIIDPLRDFEPYLQMADKANGKIKYIFETHFHADFVSGHLSLAEKTGADIIFGPTANTSFPSIKAKDNQVFNLGLIKIKVLHTPGHTQESVSYLLIDEAGKETALFTGDTLFIGDVGRPDLAVKSNLSQEDLAGMLFDSLRNKIMTLPDDIIIYPGHGAGSSCGKNISKETYSTLRLQKELNYALRADMSKQEFVQEVTNGLEEPPQYFPKNVELNKLGYESIESILKNGVIGLSVSEFSEIKSELNALIIDTRDPQVFKNGFIPGSINIGINGSFAPWIGSLIKNIKQPILFVAEEGYEKEVVTRLSRVGYDNTLGYLEGGINSWSLDNRKIETIQSISAQELANKIREDIYVLDVRKKGEYESEHIDALNLEHFPLDTLYQNINDLDKNSQYYIHCASGYRSMIFSSILKSNGFNNIIEVAGGFKAISKTSIPTTAFICPSTL